MLKFLFDRYSKVVYFMEVLGIGFTIAWVWKIFNNPVSLFTEVLLALYIFEYLFNRFCATWRWHRQAKRYEGIELHFKKSMIPISYLLAIASAVGFFTDSTALVWFSIFVFSVMTYANATLLYLHFKDKNKTPVNYYSNLKYKN